MTYMRDELKWIGKRRVVAVLKDGGINLFVIAGIVMRMKILLYGIFTPGVCIISSYRDILESIVDNEFKKKIENYYVKYVKNGIRDFENLQSRDVITTKYDWYSYENEFRLLMYLSKDNPDKGFKVRVSPQKLIKGIILSPSMDKTYKDEVYEICNTFDISTELIKDSVIEDNTFKGRF